MTDPPNSVLLVPLDPDSGLENIPVNTLPFLISRVDGIFAQYKNKFPEQFKTLSRNHAKITLEHNTYYIQDLGSTNGTTVSGTRLAEKALPLNDGDQVSFGEFFAYQVQLSCSISILLVPLDPDSGLENIPINTLPFLISRVDGIFAQYKNKFPEQFKTLSRNHAKITLEHNTYYIQDLGSTNGTTVSGTRLAEKSLPLNDGDQVSFGEFFAYQVQLVPLKVELTEFSTDVITLETESSRSDGIQKLIKQGDEHLSNAQYEQASLAFKLALQSGPENETIASRLQKAEREKQKEEEFRKLFELGNGCFGKGEFKEAIVSYEKALELRPNAVDVKEQLDKVQDEINFLNLLNAADRHLEKREIEQVLKALDKASKIRPDDKDLKRRLQKVYEINALEVRYNEIVSLGKQALEDEDYDAAAQLFQEAKKFVELKPEAAEIKEFLNKLKKMSEAKLSEKDNDKINTHALGGETIFIKNATLFLKAISQKKPDESIHSEDVISQVENVSDTSSAISFADQQQVNKASVFKEIISLFFADHTKSKHRKFYFCSFLFVIFLILILCIVIVRLPERRIRGYIAKEEYTIGLRLSDSKLAKNPNNKSLRALATEALMGWIIKNWITLFEKTRLSDAGKLLDEAVQLSKHNPEGQKLLELLTWILDLEDYGKRTGTDSKVVIFKDEMEIEQLLNKWVANENQFRFFLDHISTKYPSFERVRRRVFKQLNTLKSLSSVELAAINELKRNIREALNNNQPQLLHKTLNEFEERFPKVDGVGKIKNDLINYITFWKAVNSKQVFETSTILATRSFETPPFIDKVKEIRSKELPSADIWNEYLRAADAWSSGNGNLAINILNPLVEKQWGEVAKKNINRFHQILDEFSALEQSKGKANYGKMLLTLYSKLRPEEDNYYISLLNKNYLKFKKDEIIRAKKSFESANNSWNSYVKGGRISGYLRLENQVSKKYKQQAKYLNNAIEQVLVGTSIYKLLKLDPPEKWKILNKQITDEVEVQHLRLDSLKGVLNSNVLMEKLALLPKL